MTCRLWNSVKESLLVQTAEGAIVFFQHLLGGFIVIVLATTLCSFFFWLAIRLWTKVEQKHIRLWALMPTILVFFVIAIWVSDAVEALLMSCWPDADISWIATEIALFEALLLTGIVYVAVKRLLFFLLERTELITPFDFRKNRKRYFFWLSFCLWGMLFSFSELPRKIGHMAIWEHDWYCFAALLLPIAAAMLFYKLCLWLFVTRPFKAMQPKPAGVEQ